MFHKGNSKLVSWLKPGFKPGSQREVEKILKRFDNEFPIEEITVKGPDLAEWLVEYTVLGLSKICPELSLYYIYNPGTGIYNLLSRELFEKRIYEVLKLLERNLSHGFISRIATQLEFLVYTHPDSILKNRRFICFKNGLLDLETNKLHPHTPEILLTSRLEFDYDPSAKTTHWASFVKDFY